MEENSIYQEPIVEDEAQNFDDGQVLDDIYGSPEAYDYSITQLPEGMELDSEMVEKFNPIAKKFNLSNKSANELLNLAIQMQQKNLAGFRDAHLKLQDDERNSYKDLLQNDQELNLKSSDEYGQYLSTASKGLKAFATDGFLELLKDKGLTHHPDFIKTFYNIGKLCQPNGMPIVNIPPVRKPTTAEILYGPRD